MKVKLHPLHPPLLVQRQQDPEHRGADSEEDDRCRFESGKIQRAVFGTRLAVISLAFS